MQAFCTSALHHTVVPCDSMAFVYLNWTSAGNDLRNMFVAATMAGG